jgi:hypothetical protein
MAMIVQSAPEGEAHFVINMEQHTALSGALARAFGNDRFVGLDPLDEMLFVIDHHDQGWADLDSAPGRDAETGLPWNLVKTPFERIIKTSSLSPDFNEKHHPYCGLISSMHSWGLYNGRYGLSDRVLLDMLVDDNRRVASAMLDGEIERQDRLKARLADGADTAAWIEDDHLFQNYKQLQFFDTMALYFNQAPEGDRGEASFDHVPLNDREDVSVELRPKGGGTYALAPFPFAKDGTEISFRGRYLAPQPEGADMVAALRAIAEETQTIRLVAG